MFCAIFSNSKMGAILECQIAKNQNSFIQETFWHKVGSISTNTLTCIFLFNIETTQCKNHLDKNLVEMHSGVIEILSFSPSVLFLVMANGGHLGMPNCKKIKTASYKKHSGTRLDQFQPMVLEISSFSCLCYFWYPPSWIVNLHKFEIVTFKKSKRLHTRNILAQNGSISSYGS